MSARPARIASGALAARARRRLRSLPGVATLRDAARETGAEIWIVGGTVRDAALGRPSEDLDLICTSRTPAVVRELSRRYGSRGFRFRKRGVTTWRWAVGSARVDLVEAARRGLVEDLRRRDFTLNAVAWHVGDGRIEDPLRGLADLAAGRLRLPRPGVLLEDPLRVLRAARFLAQFPALRLTRAAAAEALRAAPALRRVSTERVRDELNKLLAAPAPGRGLDTLADFDLVPAVLPELVALRHCVAGKGRPDVWRHTVDAVAISAEASKHRLPGRDAARDPDDLLVLRWALLLHDISKPETLAFRPSDSKPTFHGHEVLGARRADALALRLLLPRQIRRRVVRLVRLHLRPGHLADGGASSRAVRRLAAAAGEDLGLLVLHAACDAQASGSPDADRRWRVLRRVLGTLLEAGRRAQATAPPLVDGRDVMRVVAIAPGPAVGRILARLRDLQVAGEIVTRDEALAWLASGAAD